MYVPHAYRNGLYHVLLVGSNWIIHDNVLLEVQVTVLNI